MKLLDSKLLKGKKVNILGDSITVGAGASDPNNKYINVFKKISGADLEVNGIGGTRIAIQHNPSTSSDPVFNKYFASRIDEMRKDADYVVVFGGTNDFGHGDAPFGKFGDKSSETFYGALYELYSKLYETYPTSRIIVITPLHRENEDDTVNEIGLPCHVLKDYVDAIKDMASYFSIPVLDLYSNANMTAKVKIANKALFYDGLHPTDLGHRRIAESLYKFIINNFLV